MNTAFLIFTCAVLAGCSTLQLAPSKRDVPTPASMIFPSGDGRLYATIRYNKQPYTVAIMERESGRVLGTAESSVRLNLEGNRMLGEVRVTFASNLSAIVVHEEFSDASPNPRYILFQRPPGSTLYRTCYFAPPTAHTDAPGEFDFICPRIVSVPGESMTLDYYDGRTRVIAISDLLQTRIPRSSQEWPSKAYSRYEPEA